MLVNTSASHASRLFVLMVVIAQVIPEEISSLKIAPKPGKKLAHVSSSAILLQE